MIFPFCSVQESANKSGLKPVVAHWPALTTRRKDRPMADKPDSIEEWRVIDIAPTYLVSNKGNVKRGEAPQHWRSWKPIKQYKTPDGYMTVNMVIDNNWTRKTFQVHPLVCSAFNGPKPSPKHQVAHNDGVRTNNASGNLRWATAKENTGDRVRHGTSPVGVNNPRAKLTEQQVRKIRSTKIVRGTKAALARKYGLSFTSVSRIISGDLWGHVGAGGGR